MDFIKANRKLAGIRKNIFSTRKEKETITTSYKYNPFASVQKYVSDAKTPQEQPLRTIQPKPKPPTAYMRKTNKSTLSRGINDHFLYLRKQNHLNSCFNVRKNKLKELTKANKEMFNRLNSQKSMYSNDQMNKSYQSIKEIKDRLSQSKLSHRSLSRQSSQKSLKSTRSVRGLHKKKQKYEKIPMKVQAMDINRINLKEIDPFKELFSKQTDKKVKKTVQNAEDVYRNNSYKKNGSYVRSMKVSSRQSVLTSKDVEKIKGQKSVEGGLLHRIVEDLKQNRLGSIKKAR